MNKVLLPLVFSVLVSFMIFNFISPVYADVDEYEILKIQEYEQTANNVQPTTPTEFFFEVDISTTASGDFAAVNLGGAPASPVALFNDALSWKLFDQYMSKTALDNAYPNANSYTLDTSGGNLVDPFSEPITFGATDNYSTVVPFFTGSTYNDLQGADSNAAINLTWNLPSSGGTQVKSVEVSIDEVPFNLLYFEELTVSETSTMIPASTLSPNTDYIVFLVWSSDVVDTRNDFLTGEGISAFALETRIEFTTADVQIGGTFVPIDQSALLLAGVQSVSMWMIPVVLAGAGIGIFVIKKRN